MQIYLVCLIIFIFSNCLLYVIYDWFKVNLCHIKELILFFNYIKIFIDKKTKFFKVGLYRKIRLMTILGLI